MASAACELGRDRSVLERRLAAEWDLLTVLAQRNPERLGDLSAEDLRFGVTLRWTPALRLHGAVTLGSDSVECEHRLQIDFPRFFPAAPMEVFLHKPMQHPNIHPANGFVCLWQRHSALNTVEHAVLKTAAVLGWRLTNAEAVHVMQPAALMRWRAMGEEVAHLLFAPPLLGAQPHAPAPWPKDAGARRQRLS